MLCSPAARRSEYVDEEIREFAASKGTDKIVPVLVAGIPNNEATPDREQDKAFPEALCELMEMPLAANYLGFDVNKHRVDRGAYFEAWSTLLANIFGVSRSELEQRERKRRARFVTVAVSATAAVVAVLVIALIVTLIARAEAVAQAVAARRETSTRLAVQALEKLNGSPEEGLALAIQAVETYREHGDPPISRALEALHKVRLSFGGGRPLLPWREDQETLIYSPDLSWAATSASDGTIRLARAGGGAAEVLAPPTEALPDGRHWTDGDDSKLLFTAERLFAARAFAGEDYTGGDEGLLWTWPLTDAGIAGPALVVGRIEHSEWRNVALVASADGRWLSWGDGHGTVFVQAVGSAEPPLTVDTDDQAQKVRAFSPDLTELIVGASDGWQRVRLDGAAGTAEATELLPSDLYKVVAYATAEPAWWPREAAGSTGGTDWRQGAGFGRLALLGVFGEAEWWDLETAPATRHELPNLFAAYAAEMQIFGLDAEHVHAELSFGGDRALLATFVHDSRELGIAAWIDATEGTEWTPVIVEQLRSQTVASMGNVSGDALGATSGYRLLDQKKLGAAAATWFGPPAVITLGFDGTLGFRDLENGRESVFGVNAAALAPQGFDRLVMVGGQDGTLRVYDGGDEDATLRLSGHDLPVREIARTAHKIVTVDTAGDGRVWSLDNPVLDADGFEWVTPDWHWAVYEAGAVDLSAPDPFLLTPAASPPAKPICTPGGCESFATVEIGDDAGRVKVRLWSLRDGAVASSPDAERDFTFPALGDRWSWHPHEFRLSLGPTSARLLMSGGRYSASGAWIVDLRDDNASPRQVIDADDGLEIESVSEDLSRLLAGKGDSVRGDGKTELRLLDLAAPGAEPALVLPQLRYGALGPDGRWLAVGDALYDLDADRGTLRFQNEEDRRSIHFILAPKRPPLFLDDEGKLWGLDDTAGSRAPALELIAGRDLTAAAWDPSGRWLGLGDREGRAWIVAPNGEGIAPLAAALAGVDASSALPAAWDPAAHDKIYSLSMLPREGWALAETDDEHVLLWRRDPRRGWSEPFVFDDRDLHDGSGAFTCRPDGLLCIVKGQILSFDEPQLIATSKALLTGRVGYDAGR